MQKEKENYIPCAFEVIDGLSATTTVANIL
jgi:hypothetical protein